MVTQTPDIRADVDPLVDQLRARRVALGLNQRVFAQLVGASQSQVSETECGLTSPRLRTLRRWCDALDLHLVAVPCRLRSSTGGTQ